MTSILKTTLVALALLSGAAAAQADGISDAVRYGHTVHTHGILGAR